MLQSESIQLKVFSLRCSCQLLQEHKKKKKKMHDHSKHSHRIFLGVCMRVEKKKKGLQSEGESAPCV